MTSKELFNLLRQNSSSDDEFLEVLAMMLSEVAGSLEISGSKNDVHDAAQALNLAAGHMED